MIYIYIRRSGLTSHIEVCDGDHSDVIAEAGPIGGQVRDATGYQRVAEGYHRTRRSNESTIHSKCHRFHGAGTIQ